MAGDNDDKDNEPNPEPPTEGVGTGAGAGDTPGKGSGKVPPSPEGQGKVQGKKTGTSADDDDFFDTHSSDSEDSDKKKKKPKRPDAFDLLPGLKDVPEGRAQRSFLRAGSRQSVGVGRTEDDSVVNFDANNQTNSMQMKDKSFLVDSTSALPLVHRVPWFFDWFKFSSACLLTGSHLSISGVMSG